MLSIIETIKAVALQVDRLIKEESLEYSSGCNATGDDQLKLDVASDLLIEKALSALPVIHTLISEEKESRFPVHSEGRYTVCYDPLDGSSIVDVDFSVGSIFGIYDGTEPGGPNLAATVYVVYGPRIEMVVARRGRGARHYRHSGEGIFTETCSRLSLDRQGKINAPGGTQRYWSPVHKAFIDSLFAQGYRLRYSGGMVPDLHQILLKGGGLFSYPATEDRPEGKLRMLFEAIPFALVFQEAGGAAIDHLGRALLELQPKHPHQSTPCFFGSLEEIERLKEAYGL